MSKPASQRAPFNAPPSATALAARGLSLLKTKRGPMGEDGPAALPRAKECAAMQRKVIVQETPYMASGFWLWIVKEAA